VGSSRGNTDNFKYQLFYLQEVLGVDIKDIDLLDRPRVSHRYYEDPDQMRHDFSEFVNMEQYLLPAPECLTEMMIDVNGDLYPCCNNFVGRIGNLNSSRIREILETSNNNKCFNMILHGGPFKLATYLDGAFNTDFSKGRYSTWCELCARIFQYGSLNDLLTKSNN
jgi:MoaA/NifB/PqqE/SkfB family radical SAM enzyme